MLHRQSDTFHESENFQDRRDNHRSKRKSKHEHFELRTSRGVAGRSLARHRGFVGTRKGAVLGRVKECKEMDIELNAIQMRFLMSQRSFTIPVFRKATRIASVSKLGTVVLTRPSGSDNKAKKALLEKGIDSVEFPLIEFTTRPEVEYLTTLLKSQNFDWVTLTSPQATRVFLQAWEDAGRPSVRIATFEASLKILKDAPIDIGYIPNTSKGVHLGNELPRDLSKCEQVLYPASHQADDTLEKALRERHFVVTRLDTYETTTIKNFDLEALEAAKAANVITFASPTAVRAWKEISGAACDLKQNVACIGSTTAEEAKAQGFENVTFPEQPGMDALVESIVQILQELKVS